MIKVNDLRISWIWMETFPDLLVNTPRLKSRWGNLGFNLDYNSVFKNPETQPDPLSLPWNTSSPKHIHYFWRYYLGKNCAQVTPEEAFKRLVPFRRSGSARVMTPWPSGKLMMESYHYPHGMALVMTVHIRDDLSLDDMVDRAVEAAQDATFQVTWVDGSSDALTMPQLASEAMDDLRSFVYGKAPQGTPSLKPFTVATVVRGSDVNQDAPNIDGDPVHRALEGLCSWQATWKHDTLHPLAKRAVGIRHAPPSHLLYGLPRGRAVWFPASFLDLQKPRSSLACYHRNLMFASLQTESLASLMVLARDRYQSPVTASPMSGSMQALVESAADILGRLYTGDTRTYRSSSPTVQIRDNHWLDTINFVRKVFGQAPLQ
jgi:hypothetical protein